MTIFLDYIVVPILGLLAIAFVISLAVAVVKFAWNLVANLVQFVLGALAIVGILGPLTMLGEQFLIRESIDIAELKFTMLCLGGGVLAALAYALWEKLPRFHIEDNLGESGNSGYPGYDGPEVGSNNWIADNPNSLQAQDWSVNKPNANRD